MRTDTPQPIRLSDYRPPAFLIDEAHLAFDLQPNTTRVKATLTVRRNGDHAGPLRFNGERLKLISAAIDGRVLGADEYAVDAEFLTIAKVPDAFTLETEVEIDNGDLRIDVFRSSGPGGQSVNTTDSAVRITHLPTGIVVSCQNERSQLQNKDRAMRMLRAKLAALREEQAAAAASDARKAQIRTVDRSERIRTYNFPQNRISDHRIGFTAYNLDLVIGGDLDGVLDALGEADRQARLAGETELTRR